MANNKITSTLLLATSAFISMPIIANPPSVGKRAGSRIKQRIADQDKKLAPRVGKRASKRIIKPKAPSLNPRSGIVGRRIKPKPPKLDPRTGSKVGIRVQKPGIRANKLKEMKK